MSYAPNLNLNGLHALVCGASSGIGRAIALSLAELGAEITALARREALLEALLPDLVEAGAPLARAIVADLSDTADLRDKVTALIAESGPVHILINNTGGPPGGPLLQSPAAALELAFRQHVVAAHTLTQLALPGMVDADYGRIINILSTSVREPIPNLGVSNTIRGAMASWAKTLAMELPPGVTINNVLPGYTDTDRLSALREASAARQGVSAESVGQAWLAAIPEGRLGEPQELAGLVAFLASESGAYIRGTSIPVDGGRLRSLG